MSLPLAALQSRLGLPNDKMDRFARTLDRAIDTYRWAKHWESMQTSEGSPEVAHQLDRLHRSLGRTANLRMTAKHWAGLSEEGRTFIEMRLRMADPTLKGFTCLDLTNASDLVRLRDAVGAARRWLSAKPGREHGPAIRELVTEVARAYRRTTGKRPGLSSSAVVAGPSYATPFEEILMAVLTEAGIPLSLEAARSLYRYELRGKPKKSQP